MINKNVLKNLLSLSAITAGLLGTLVLSPATLAANAADNKDEKTMTLESTQAPAMDDETSTKQDDETTDTDLIDSAGDSAADSAE